MINGFLPIDKAPGWTSHDVVAKVRGIVHQKKVGHAGTLDPSATGLLVLGLGKATRLLRFIQAYRKEYVAKVAFGVTTDTLDADGAILHREPMSFEEGDLRTVIGRFVGVIAQVPPMVSAVKVGGQRLYELARQGKEIERAARMVEVYGIEVLDFAPGPYPEATLRVQCGSGTYIRTLGADIGQALGGGAHVAELRRTRLGWMEADQDARTVEQVADTSPSFGLLSMADGLRDLPAVHVDEKTAEAVRHGMQFPIGTFPTETAADADVRIVGADEELLAVYRIQSRLWSPEVVVA